MRWIYNCILIVTGLPLLATTFLLIMHFVPAFADDFKWPSHLYTSGAWVIFMALFLFSYGKRTTWLETIGIFKSWSNFNAYMLEGHGYPEVSQQERIEFMSWANLSEERPPKFRTMAKNIYNRIKIEIKLKQQQAYIKSLAWYMSGLPLYEDEFEENHKNKIT